MNSIELIIEDIIHALDGRAFITALQATLTLPDICSTLELGENDDKKHGKGDRYAKWYDTYVKKDHDFLNGNTCWKFRCSLLHEGSGYFEPVYTKLGTHTGRVLFVCSGETSEYKGLIHNNMINEAVQLDVDTFCHQMIEAVQKWNDSARNTDNYKNNIEKTVGIYPNGLAGYINGVTCIG